MRHLRGYWKSDEGAGGVLNDISKSALDATLSGNYSWEAAGGPGGIPCVVYQDPSNYGQALTAAHIDLEDLSFTAACWVRNEVAATWFNNGGIMSLTDSGPGQSVGWFFVSRTNGEILLKDDTAPNAVTLEQMTVDAWNHVAITYKRSNLKIYINGDRCTPSGGSSPFEGRTIDAPATYVLAIGSYDNNSAQCDNKICEASFWGRALDGAEIRKLWNNGTPLDARNLDREWENIGLNPGQPFQRRRRR